MGGQSLDQPFVIRHRVVGVHRHDVAEEGNNGGEDGWRRIKLAEEGDEGRYI